METAATATSNSASVPVSPTHHWDRGGAALADASVPLGRPSCRESLWLGGMAARFAFGPLPHDQTTPSSTEVDNHNVCLITDSNGLGC